MKKGIGQWFKSSAKMKRWLALIVVGIILACYGIAEIIAKQEISFQEVGKIGVIFVAGFLAIVIGLVCLSKRALEVFIESTDERMKNKKNININSLIFNKKVYEKGPKIVVIGGGTGLNTVLSGLKQYTNNLTAIVTVSDYGEGVTESKNELGVKPIEDIKDSIVALAGKDGQINNLFNYSFKTGRLAGLDFSDIFFSAMKEINGNFEDSIIKSNEVLNIIGNVIPVTLDEMNIVAELANGYVVKEKSRIADVVSEKITKINRIMLSPSNCKPAPGVIDAIKSADCIIIGPGSLYTNVIPNLLVNGITKAIKESNSIKVYVSNIMTEPGQTDNYSVSDHLNAIIEHCGTGVIDYCIYDTGEIVPEFIKKYNKEGQDIVEQDIEKVKGIKFLQRNLSMVKDEMIRHDPNLVGASIIELICDDLKYQDKQADPQYVMLNTKLREEKRINKIKKNMAKKEMQKRTKIKKEKQWKSKSKFSNKYSDRIASIREADAKAAIRREKDSKLRAKKNKKEKQRTTANVKGSNSISNKNVKRQVGSTKTRKMTQEEIRAEMLKKLEDSGLK
ncbi:MAG: YvcK family protein [Clostridia bacterium]|nr:YvcK family protein [Clostridia bacterium]